MHSYFLLFLAEIQIKNDIFFIANFRKTDKMRLSRNEALYRAYYCRVCSLHQGTCYHARSPESASRLGDIKVVDVGRQVKF